LENSLYYLTIANNNYLLIIYILYREKYKIFDKIMKNDPSRKLLEAELKEMEEKYRKVFNNANDMIGLNLIEENGLPGKFIDINKIGIERLGYSYEEFLNMTPADIIAPDKQSQISKNALELSKNGHATFEIVHQTKSGKRIPVEVNNHLFILEGKLIALAISRDITERKKAEKALKKSHDNLELKVKERTNELEEVINALKHSNEELEQFAHVTSHDLREPLRMITSFLQLLEKRYDNQLDDDAHEFIEFAVDGAKRLDSMINDLLKYSQVKSMEREFVQVDTEKVLDDTLLNLKVPIDENNAIITHDPLPKIIGDKEMLIQLFQNLISNSIKYRSDKSPEIHISAVKEGNEYCFSVKDNGIGISPDHLKRIFVIFQRLHTHEEYVGTGIGLAIAQKIVHQFGGQIWVESEEGKGSIFYFTIPNRVGETILNNSKNLYCDI
jgi:PAS domain S-box-containing protein